MKPLQSSDWPNMKFTDQQGSIQPIKKGGVSAQSKPKTAPAHSFQTPFFYTEVRSRLQRVYMCSCGVDLPRFYDNPSPFMAKKGFFSFYRDNNSDFWIGRQGKKMGKKISGLISQIIDNVVHLQLNIRFYPGGLSCTYETIQDEKPEQRCFDSGKPDPSKGQPNKAFI